MKKSNQSSLQNSNKTTTQSNGKIQNGKYQHYKRGKLYQVIGFALHSETYEEMVIYQAPYNCEKFGNNRVWTRPEKMHLK